MDYKIKTTEEYLKMELSEINKEQRKLLRIAEIRELEFLINSYEHIVTYDAAKTIDILKVLIASRIQES